MPAFQFVESRDGLAAIVANLQDVVGPFLLTKAGPLSALQFLLDKDADLGATPMDALKAGRLDAVREAGPVRSTGRSDLMSRGAGFDLGDVVLEWPVPAGALISPRSLVGARSPWNSANSRSRTFGGLFDPPPGDFAVIYAAERLAGAFVETLPAAPCSGSWARGLCGGPLVEPAHQRHVRCGSSRPSVTVCPSTGLKPWSDLEHARAQSHALAEARFTPIASYSMASPTTRAKTAAKICYAGLRARGDARPAPGPKRSTPLDQARSEVDGLMRRYGGVWDLSPPVRLDLTALGAAHFLYRSRAGCR